MTFPAVLNLVPGDSTEGCSFWRVWRPVTLLKEAGYPCDWDRIGNDDAGLVLHRYNALVNQRVGWPDYERDGKAFVDSLHKGNIAVWQEVDDDIWANREDQLDHKAMGFEELELTAEQNRDSTSCYDGVIVSTERLRTVLHSFCPDMPCEVVGNYIDVGLWETLLLGWERHEALRGHVTVGWFGGQRHDKDLAEMAEGWRRIAARFPDVQFVLQGYIPRLVRDSVPAERLHTLPWLPVVPKDNKPFYGAGLLSLDVACCSVADTMFNRAKTPIKVYESTVAGAAVCVSPVLYGPLVESGVDGYVCENADAWEEGIAKLVTSKSRRLNMRSRMLAKVKERWSLADNVWRWPAAWANLYAAFQSKQRRRVILPQGVTV